MEDALTGAEAQLREHDDAIDRGGQVLLLAQPRSIPPELLARHREFELFDAYQSDPDSRWEYQFAILRG